MTDSECAGGGADLPAPGRHPAGDRAGRRAGERADVEQIAGRLDQAFPLAHRRQPHRAAAPADAARRDRLELRIALATGTGLLRRLSVFTGSFDLLAVEAMCCLEADEEMDVLDLLASLVNKSILLVEPQPDQDMRYRLLETIRQYACEKLDDAGENLPMHELHAGYYLDLVKLDGPNDVTRQTPTWLRQVDIDFPNIRAAMMWALESRAPEQAIAALLPLWWYWSDARHARRRSVFIGKSTQLCRCTASLARPRRPDVQSGSFRYAPGHL